MDDAENKLEYTAVYENYLKLIEKVLEKQVMERHTISDEEMNGFYASLKGSQEKIKMLEDIDKDSLDTLFEFCNFDTFKSCMVEAKKSKDGTIDSDNLAIMSGLSKDTEIFGNALGNNFKEFLNNFNEDLKTWKL